LFASESIRAELESGGRTACSIAIQAQDLAISCFCLSS